ncbi:MAG TPA: hypothetical protein DCR17_04260 [Verrucomicrobiales bacterium]|nr:hypothetical protein [Pedosphaera sp.]HAO65881.1 hypothetical protein [Verrucomicrobiales bacterium]MAH96836.1 hypothetical protein [Pedosphaera sp.]HAQ98490.1 hypothetical protein [Verrucomicrobiales bacterium]HBP57118.1 hypothetical protein [Verrucomicrobiales bacterium]
MKAGYCSKENKSITQRPSNESKFEPGIRTPAKLARRRLSFRKFFTFLFTIFWMDQLELKPKHELTLRIKLTWIHLR